MAEAVARHHRTVVFAPGIEARALGSNITAVGRQVTALRGYLGAFQAEVSAASRVSDIGAASPNPNRFFDIVLDLGRQPLCTSAVAPLGWTLILVGDPRSSPRSRQTLASSVAQMHALLPTLGIARERLVWLAESALARWLEAPSNRRLESVPATAAVGKPAQRPSASFTRHRERSVAIHGREPGAWITALRSQ